MTGADVGARRAGLCHRPNQGGLHLSQQVLQLVLVDLVGQRHKPLLALFVVVHCGLLPHRLELLLGDNLRGEMQRPSEKRPGASAYVDR